MQKHLQFLSRIVTTNFALMVAQPSKASIEILKIVVISFAPLRNCS